MAGSGCILMNSKNKFYYAISGVVLVVVFWIWWVSTNPASEQALVKFLSVQQLFAEEQAERIRLGGLVADESIKLDENNYLSCNFDLQEGEAILRVHFVGVRPDLFKNGAEVIVEGIYMNGVFEADILQTKCASRYEGDLRDADSYNLEEVSI
jgi:cytochrome c-type biogenesis protein CcmE